MLLRGGPVVLGAIAAGGVDGAGLDSAQESGVESAQRVKSMLLGPSVPVDLLFDDHVVELEECRRWANSDAGQVARIENPTGFANVRAHAESHMNAIGLASAQANAQASEQANVQVNAQRGRQNDARRDTQQSTASK